MKKILIIASLVSFSFCNLVYGSSSLDLPKYQKTSGVEGTLSSVGSDTLNNLMTFWSEKFREIYPNIRIQVEGKGSSTAPPALISSTAQLAPMSRRMKNSEINKFENVFGYKPSYIRVSIDALAIFVNKNNSLPGISFSEADAIFSVNRNRGSSHEITTWGELGLKKWQKKHISVYGRNSASGTYGYFKKVILKKGDYKNTVKEQPGSASVVQSISVDQYSIGYSGIGYKTAGVRALPISIKGKKYVEPTPDNAFSGDYPLSRFLYIYFNKKPGKELIPLVKQFLLMVLSDEGQKIVIKGGYFPLSNGIVVVEKKKL